MRLEKQLTVKSCRARGPPDTPVVHFQYAPGRATDVPEKLIEGFEGVLMSYVRLCAIKRSAVP